MKKIIQLIVGSVLLLSGCTYATDTMSHPPEIEWTVPASIDVKTPVDMMISLQSSKKEELKVISLVLKKQGETEIKDVPFEQDDKGNIEIHTSFDEEGVYNLQAKIETGNQTIQPIRQIVVGEVTSAGGKQEEESNEEGHSNHH